MIDYFIGIAYFSLGTGILTNYYGCGLMFFMVSTAISVCFLAANVEEDYYG